MQLSYTYCVCALSLEAIDSLLCSNPAQPSNTSMTSCFSLSTAIAMLDIPMPEDDDMSKDEFDGYLGTMLVMTMWMEISMVQLMTLSMMTLKLIYPFQTLSNYLDVHKT